jgi:hypothetical protein
MWWDGGYEQNPDDLSIKRNMKIATILPFEAVGTVASQVISSFYRLSMTIPTQLIDLS